MAKTKPAEGPESPPEGCPLTADKSAKEKKKKQTGKIHRWRFASQFSFVFLLNPYFFLFRGFCFPAMNCWACPAAAFGCPVGGIGEFLALGLIPYLAIGLMLIAGALVGRLICGWVCPFGFIQDLFAKIPIKKLPLPRPLSYMKYVILVMAVFLIPTLWGIQPGAGPKVEFESSEAAALRTSLNEEFAGLETKIAEGEERFAGLDEEALAAEDEEYERLDAEMGRLSGEIEAWEARRDEVAAKIEDLPEPPSISATDFYFCRFCPAGTLEAAIPVRLFGSRFDGVGAPAIDGGGPAADKGGETAGGAEDDAGDLFGGESMGAPDLFGEDGGEDAGGAGGDWLAAAGAGGGAAAAEAAGVPMSSASLGFGGGFLTSSRMIVLYVFLLAFLLIRRPFCRMVCPVGAMFALLNRFSLFRVKVRKDACKACNLCAKGCPVDNKVYVTPASDDCIRCFECVSNCKRGGVEAGLLSALPNEDYWE